MNDLQLLHKKPNKSPSYCSEKQPAERKRKYLPYGFTSIGDEKSPDAVSILCHTILANRWLAPDKLQRQMETRHSDNKNKDISVFGRKDEF